MNFYKLLEIILGIFLLILGIFSVVDIIKVFNVFNLAASVFLLYAAYKFIHHAIQTREFVIIPLHGFIAGAILIFLPLYYEVGLTLNPSSLILEITTFPGILFHLFLLFLAFSSIIILYAFFRNCGGLKSFLGEIRNGIKEEFKINRSNFFNKFNFFLKSFLLVLSIIILLIVAILSLLLALELDKKEAYMYFGAAIHLFLIVSWSILFSVEYTSFCISEKYRKNKGFEVDKK